MSKAATVAALIALSLGAGGPSAYAKSPSTSTVNRTVAKKFKAQIDSSGAAKCRKTGRASWSCQIRTDRDRLAVAMAISSGSGVTYAEMQEEWYSYRCTARFAKGRVTVGRFIRHRYDTGR